MKDKALDFYKSMRARWDGLEIIQKRRLTMVVAGLVVAIGVSIFFVARPNWVSLLPANVSHQTVQEARTILADNGIPYRLRQGGRTIEVRERDHNLAAIEVTTNAAAFSMETDRFLLQNVLAEINMSTSDATRDEMFRRVDENELAIMLLAIEGIEDANVQIVQADTRSAFLGTGTSSASVMLNVSRQFSRDEALQMAQMVAASVDHLTIDDVVITDQFLTNIFYGGAVGNDRFGGNSEIDMRLQRTAQVENGVRNVLRGMFSDVSVMATVSLDQNDTTVHSVILEDPLGTGQGVTTELHELREAAEGTGVPGIEPGAFANDGGFPGPLMATPSGEMSAEREVITHTRDFNRIETVTVQEIGRLIPEDSSISAVASTDMFIHQEQFENGSIVAVLPEGVFYFEGMTWEQFVLGNTNSIPMPIDDSMTTLVATASGIPADNITVMGFYNLMFIDTPAVPIDWYAIILFGILAAFLAMLILGLLRRNKEEEIIDIEPELSVEDLLVSTQIEEMQDDHDSLQEIAYSIDSEVKQQIDKFVTEKPEAVAQLLRSWMNEGWE